MNKVFFLILAIICSSSIALIFKYTEGNGMNRYAVTSANYLIAFLVSIIMFLYDNSLNLSFSLSISTFLSEASSVIFSNSTLFSAESSVIWAMLIGCFAGVFFFLSFVYYQKSVKENGVGLSGTFGKLGILIPMIFSIILWNEIPTLVQWTGIVLSLLSIIIVNFSIKDLTSKSLNWTLILLFIFGGMAEFSNKIFQKYSITEYKNLFLFFVFFIAFLISIFFTIKEKKPVSNKDILLGLLVGIPNLFSSYFLIIALNYITTSVAFPIYSAGSILIINLGGFIIFKEKLSKKDTFAVIMTLFALILINM
jgi:multidrug transporter EmrE-like cation transporter